MAGVDDPMGNISRASPRDQYRQPSAADGDIGGLRDAHDIRWRSAASIARVE